MARNLLPYPLRRSDSERQSARAARYGPRHLASGRQHLGGRRRQLGDAPGSAVGDVDSEGSHEVRGRWRRSGGAHRGEARPACWLAVLVVVRRTYRRRISTARDDVALGLHCRVALPVHAPQPRAAPRQPAVPRAARSQPRAARTSHAHSRSRGVAHGHGARRPRVLSGRLCDSAVGRPGVQRHAPQVRLRNKDSPTPVALPKHSLRHLL